MRQGLTAFLTALTLTIFTAARAEEPTFSWTNLIGKNFEEFQNQLSGTVVCEQLQSQTYRLPVSPKLLSLDEFSTWDYPSSASSLVSDELSHSEKIQTSSCRIGNSASLRVHLFQDKIFTIAIGYRNCAVNPSDCKPQPNDFDKVAFEKLGKELVVLPIYGSGEITSEEYSDYEEYEDNLRAISLFRVNSAQNESCFFFGLNNTTWRCLVGFQKFGDVLQTFGFAEIHTGTIFHNSKEEIFSSQTFTNQKQALVAAEAFLSDVNLEIARINTENNSQKDKATKTKKVIESVQ